VKADGAPRGSSILVVDDERGIRSLCGDVLRRAGYVVDVVENGAGAIAACKTRRFDLVLCDINLPDITGLQVMETLLGEGGGAAPTFILITAHPSVDTAVRGMKLGARDYIAKPFTPDELRMVADRALSEDALRRENSELRRELAYGNLLGESEPMQALRETIAKVARADVTVLITGESGTGKELVARAIHYEGERAGKPFVAVNCGALVGSLLESELFGHVRGAFTGAEQTKQGLFVSAHLGTLFLDEVGELPLELQPKLLRALQDGEVKPVGGVTTTRVDARVVAATNRDLQERVHEGAFREDLFYRLNVIAIEVPPLRERASDIPILAEHFAANAALRARRPRPALTREATDWLVSQPWPGNIRELENAMERAVVLASGDTLDASDFMPRGAAAAAAARSVPAPTALEGPDGLPSLEELERRHVERVLEAVGGHKTKAAAILGINRTTLWKKLRQYDLE
jgi:DNA-binding NtrC family response regulator